MREGEDLRMVRSAGRIVLPFSEMGKAAGSTGGESGVCLRAVKPAGSHQGIHGV